MIDIILSHRLPGPSASAGPEQQLYNYSTPTALPAPFLLGGACI